MHLHHLLIQTLLISSSAVYALPTTRSTQLEAKDAGPPISHVGITLGDSQFPRERDVAASYTPEKSKREAQRPCRPEDGSCNGIPMGDGSKKEKREPQQRTNCHSLNNCPNTR